MSITEKVLNEWKIDSKIDLTNPGNALIDIPKIHSKYLNILSEYRMNLRKIELDIKRMKKTKWEYYTGRMDEKTLQENGWEPFPYTLKSDISLYMDSDDDLYRLSVRKCVYEEVIEICVSILKELNSRTYQLRAYIDYEKFISGN